MSRKSERLFQIVTFLQGRRLAVTAERMAEELGVSPRTIYRDIQDLMLSGVPVSGEAGVGYVMDRRYHLPPVMFDDEEIECLVLGMAMVSVWTDEPTAATARRAMEKLRGVMGEEQRQILHSVALFAPPSAQKIPWTVDFSHLRRCIREKTKLHLEYVDEQGSPTERTVWPLAMTFFGPVWLLLGWCELRNDFRSFRLDRIRSATPGDAFKDETGRTLRDFMQRIDFDDGLRG
ncbi:MAG: transcriptional regulator [Alphaproteobacteria bacterium RIFOXYD12_FULL_60_8]|nr:MAG: transcriptional regulator [Alphaproteobacteria bacterium RIFOXYD12_FULL_60_8]